MKRISIFVLCLLFFETGQVLSQTTNDSSETVTAEQVVRQLYDLVTFEAGETPDWEVVKSLFVEEAVIVLRATKTSHSIFSREGFVEDFQNFIDQAKVDQTGFVEKIISLKMVEMGDVAHCWVVYEASIPGWGRPPQKGVDSFQLLKKGGQWKIVAIVNEIPTPEHPVPEEILKN